MASNMQSSADYAGLLLDKACDDAYVVRRLAGDAAAPDWVIGFHAQQAVEKALKSRLARHGIEYPRTHNLAMLVELLRRQDRTIPPSADELSRLTPFGVVQRYDDLTGEDGSTLDREWAVEIVERVLDWAKLGA
jgi:HEPN domain-containing protein